jgi:hypothetical protein
VACARAARAGGSIAVSEVAFKLADLLVLSRAIEGTEQLWAFLPPATPACSAPRGMYCICGQHVPYGTTHAHGQRSAFVPVRRTLVLSR